MPDFTIFSVSAARGAEEAEIDAVEADFESAAEAMGYARRMAEEAYQLAGQLDLDFDYSYVAVFEGEIEGDVDLTHPALVGAWLYDDEGVAWSTAAILQEADEAPAGTA
jgi:hypothetical protein